MVDENWPVLLVAQKFLRVLYILDDDDAWKLRRNFYQIRNIIHDKY